MAPNINIELQAEMPTAGGTRFPTPSLDRYIVAFICVAITVASIMLVNPGSMVQFVFYYCAWNIFIYLLHPRDLGDFSFAFLFNSAYIAIYYLIQVNVYPDSYGTTSPLGSWTDDSYFYALVADTIPKSLLVRENYELYTHPLTSFIRYLTPLSIDHPMDVIFFQSGIAAGLATFSKRFMFQLSANSKLSNTVYLFALICPFLAMNGGVIFIRDTFAATLFIYSLCCLNADRFLLGIGAISFHLLIRPGTGLIVLPLYVIIYFSEIRTFLRRHPIALCIAGLLMLVSLGAVMYLSPDFSSLIAGTSEGGGVGIFGRKMYEGLTADPGANGIFLAIQELPFILKLFLNGCYIFLYPFLSLKHAVAGEYFDVRAITLNIIAPVYAFWLNAWFVAGAVSRIRVAEKQKTITVAVLVAVLLIGTYSLQTRHKTIIYPLYYFIVAIGFSVATRHERRIGYWISSFFALLQLALLVR